MKKLFTAAVLAVSMISLGGCETLREADWPTNPNVAIGDATVVDEKAMIGLESTAILLNQAAQAAVRSGVLVPGSARAIQVADMLEEVRRGVLLARELYDAGNVRGATAQVFAMLTLIGRVQSLIG